jgi:outer membrane protein OmpA-like peptidoglycan-associated protein
VTVGSNILFTVDRPHAGENNLDSVLLRGDKSTFNSLVKQLKDNPALKVQLVGRASLEGPGDAKQAAAYNQMLGLRRATLVKTELIKNGIGRTGLRILRCGNSARNAIWKVTAW